MTGFTAAFPTHLKALKVTTTAEEEARAALLRSEVPMFSKLLTLLVSILSMISICFTASFIPKFVIWDLDTST